MTEKDEKAKGQDKRSVGQSEVDGRVSYPLPQAAVDAFDEYEAALLARNEVLKSLFKFQYKKAVYFGRIAEQSKRLFWNKVRETYPELKDGLTYDKDSGTVYKTEEGN